MTRALRLYPAWWRARYGDEMAVLLDAAPARPGWTLDLVRGALDAWLHPPTPSVAPGLAALVGGGLWTVAAAGVVAQPVAPDWPGYLLDVVPLLIAATSCLMVATAGVAVRATDRGGRRALLAAGVAIVGWLAWIVALAATSAGVADGATLGLAGSAAMVGTAAVALVLLRVGDDRIGALLLVVSVSVLIPWTAAWLVFGGGWSILGAILLVERTGRPDGRTATP